MTEPFIVDPKTGVPPDGVVHDPKDHTHRGSWRLVRSQTIRMDKARQRDNLVAERFYVGAFRREQIVTVNLVLWRVKYTDEDENFLDASVRYRWHRALGPRPGWDFEIRARLKDQDSKDLIDAEVIYRLDTWEPVERNDALHLVHRAGNLRLDGTSRSVETPLEWDTQVVRLGSYSHDGIEVRANDDGYYSVSVQCSVRSVSPGDFECAPAIALQTRQGPTWEDLPGAICYGHLRGSNVKNTSTPLSVHAVTRLHEGTRLRCVLFNGAEDLIDAETVPESTRLVVQLIQRIDGPDDAD